MLLQAYKKLAKLGVHSTVIALATCSITACNSTGLNKGWQGDFLKPSPAAMTPVNEASTADSAQGAGEKRSFSLFGKPGQAPPVEQCSFNSAQPDGERFNIPDDVRVEQLRSIELSGDLAKAEAGYRNLLDQGGASSLVYHRLAVLSDLRLQPELATELYNSAMEISPNDVELLCDAAFHCEIIKRNEHADRLYRKALAVDPSHPRTNNHLAAMLVKQGRVGDARQHFAAAGLSPHQINENIRRFSD